VASAPATCLDPETLAAWSAGALSSAERGRIEEHLADCAACQAMVSAFVRTELPEPAPTRWWQRVEVRWLVPVATAATLVAIWVALPERNLPMAQSDRVTERLESQPPVATPVEPVRQSPDTVATERSAERQSSSGLPVAEQEQRAQRPAISPAEPPPRERAAVPAAPAESREARAPAAAAPPPSQPQALSETVSLAGDAAAQKPGATGVEVRSPDPATRWRFVGGLVERTTDDGVTWERVELAPPAVLTSGHSPGVNVAWLVGRGGAVYVTADGRRFARVPFVEAIDLTFVTAIDARRATVAGQDGRRFGTSDGGATWTREK
jgi:anti-sigma factor ChrR (cupin superfamily)